MSSSTNIRRSQVLTIVLYRTYKAVANAVAKSGYRGDLRQVAVARASAIKRSQRPVRESPVSKPRGNAAKAAAATSEEN